MEVQLLSENHRKFVRRLYVFIIETLTSVVPPPPPNLISLPFLFLETSGRLSKMLYCGCGQCRLQANADHSTFPSGKGCGPDGQKHHDA